MSAEGKDTALKEWVESKRASALPPPITEVDPETDAALVGIPKVGEEILGGKYVIEQLMGIGGMGVVCAAMHKQLKQRVAIKFLAAQMRSPDLVDRFIREGQAAVRIKSEHIAPVLDVGVLEGSGCPYLMMEHLSGADLSDYLLEHRSLSVEYAVDFVLQTLDALAVAHSAGIVHRDLKPSNLFVTSRSDGSPLIKVLDFGISKIIERGPSPSVTLTRPGMMLGSPRYMSPEQLRNASSVDHRADIWAMGVVLHELLAGSPPYDADTFTALCAMIVSDEPTPLRSVKPDAPVLLEQIIQKCLQKKPDERWQNVAELADALAPLAPEESRIIATRVKKILGHKPGKTPVSSPNVSTKLSAGSTPKPNQRTLPLAQANSGTPPPSSQDIPRSSTPSPMATTGEDPRMSGPPTDPGAGALAISTASGNAAPKSNAKVFAVIAGVAIALIALGGVAMKSRSAALASTPPPPASTTVAAPAPSPSPDTPEPAVALPVPAASSTEPAAAPTPVGRPIIAPNPIGGRPRPTPPAKPSASVSTPMPLPPTATAPPSEADMLNRRR
jgi:serine/threonine-protein kinase